MEECAEKRGTLARRREMRGQGRTRDDAVSIVGWWTLRLRPVMSKLS